LRFVRTKPTAAAGGFIFLVMIFMALTAPLITSHDINALTRDRLLGPSRAHWFGTDEFGRDLYTRIVYGARISLYVGVLSVLFGTTTGALLGTVSAYFGGRLDSIVQRIMDALMAFPALVLALAVVAALGQSTINVIIAISIVILPTANRVLRASTLSAKQNMYVESARAVGATHGRIILRHILPNCMAPYIVVATVALGGAILSEASLSFLGLGTPPPDPSWGAMLSGSAQTYIRSAPWLGIFPGVAITLAVFAANLLGDGLRDILDPKLRQR